MQEQDKIKTAANRDDPMEPLFRLMRMMRRGHHPHHGPRAPGYGKLMGLIYKNEGASAGDIARWMEIRPSSLSEMLVKLEEQGEIRREKDENDARVWRIYLSENGRAKIQRDGDEHQKRHEMIFACLDEDEKQYFAKICEKLTRHIQTLHDSEKDEKHPGHHRHHQHGGESDGTDAPSHATAGESGQELPTDRARPDCHGPAEDTKDKQSPRGYDNKEGI